MSEIPQVQMSEASWGGVFEKMLAIAYEQSQHEKAKNN